MTAYDDEDEEKDTKPRQSFPVDPTRPPICSIHGLRCRSRSLHSHSAFPPHVWQCEAGCTIGECGEKKR